MANKKKKKPKTTRAVLPKKEPRPGTTLAGDILDTIISLSPLGGVTMLSRIYEKNKMKKSKPKKLKIRRAPSKLSKFKKKKVSARKTYSGKKRVF